MTTNNEALINFLMITNSNRNEVIRDIYEFSIDEQNYGPESYEYSGNPYCTYRDYIKASDEALERAIEMEHELLGMGE